MICTVLQQSRWSFIVNRQQLTVALDGEIVKMRPPLRISVLKNALKIKVPHAAASI